MTSLACTQGRSRPRSSTPTTRGVSNSNGRPAMPTATSSPPAPIAIMPSAPEVGGVAVGADQNAARAGEALDVDIVADAVAGPRVVDAIAGVEGLQEAVIVGVLEIELDHVVIDVLHRQRDAHAVAAQFLELQRRPSCRSRPAAASGRPAQQFPGRARFRR